MCWLRRLRKIYLVYPMSEYGCAHSNECTAFFKGYGPVAAHTHTHNVETAQVRTQLSYTVINSTYFLKVSPYAGHIIRVGSHAHDTTDVSSFKLFKLAVGKVCD